MSSTGDQPAPAALVTAWCALGGAGLLALLGAPAGAVSYLMVVAAFLFVVQRQLRRAATARGVRTSDVAPRDRSPGVVEPKEAIVPLAGATQAGAWWPSVDDVARMSDAELCRAWRASYVRLTRWQLIVGASAQAVEVAVERGWYLDELERRYPHGFSAWIAAGARAPSDPTRYLSHRGFEQRRDP